MTIRRTLIPLTIGALLLGGTVASYAVRAAEGSQIVGYLSQVTDKLVIVDHTRTFKLDPKKAKCFDVTGEAMTCGTLVGIGYADKARVTVIGDTVQRIDLLQLQQ